MSHLIYCYAECCYAEDEDRSRECFVRANIQNQSKLLQDSHYSYALSKYWTKMDMICYEKRSSLLHYFNIYNYCKKLLEFNILNCFFYRKAKWSQAGVTLGQPSGDNVVKLFFVMIL